MAFVDIGTKIRVKFTGTIRGERGRSAGATTLVQEDSNEKRNHLLFLGSPSVISVDMTATVDFDAEVTGKYKNGDLITTEVVDTNGNTHFIYLDSTFVTVLPEPEDEPEPKKEPKPEKFPAGTKIRFDIAGTVQGELEISRKSTSEVQESGPSYWTHFLYLGSSSVTGDTEKDGKVRAVFNGRVIGKYKEGKSSTTLVGEDGGYVHYLYLDSPAVTAIPDEPNPLSTLSAERAGSGIDVSENIPVVPPISSFPTPTYRPFLGGTAKPRTKKERTTVSIDRYDEIIDSSDVESRINELEDSQGYEVVRTRNDEVLDTFNSEDEARQYIEDEDYNPERVITRQQELDDDDARELSMLRTLIDSAERYLNKPWTIYSESFFTESWAKDQARDVLGYRVDADEWPLNLVDWDEAATERRNYLYPTEIDFDDQIYYAEES